MKKNRYLKIFINLILIIFLFILVFFLIPKILIFFMPFLIGWIISSIASPLVKYLENKFKIVRKHISFIMIVFILTLIILSSYFSIIKLYSELIDLISNLPEIYSNLSEEFIRLEANLYNLIEFLPNSIRYNLVHLGENISNYLSDLILSIGLPTVIATGNIAKNLPSFLINIIITILSSYFFIVDRDNILNFLSSLIPKSLENNIRIIKLNLKKVLGGYFKAQFQLMLIVLVIIIVGFFILDINYIFLLSIIIGILDFLPIFGSGAILIPWSIFSILSGNIKLGLGLILIYGIIQLTRQLLQPKLIGDSVGISPLATLFLIFIGFKIGGLLGLLIALPLGLMFYNLFTEGAFDNIISIMKEVINDFNDFRRLY